MGRDGRKMRREIRRKIGNMYVTAREGEEAD